VNKKTAQIKEPKMFLFYQDYTEASEYITNLLIARNSSFSDIIKEIERLLSLPEAELQAELAAAIGKDFMARVAQELQGIQQGNNICSWKTLMRGLLKDIASKGASEFRYQSKIHRAIHTTGSVG
jgi:hypothetical protein